MRNHSCEIEFYLHENEKSVSISKAEDLAWGNSEMAYLRTLPSDRGGDTCRLFGVVNCRFLGLYQVGCVPDESTINL